VLKCSKCGKEMTDELGNSVVGISILIQCGDREQLPFMQKQAGKYRIGEHYQFCLECGLDSLFRSCAVE